jgi:hypothetical protein
MAYMGAKYSNLRMRDLVWMRLAQDWDNERSFVKAIINFPVLLHAGKFLMSRENLCFSGRTLLHRVFISLVC